jgi:hypothetical protein
VGSPSYVNVHVSPEVVFCTLTSCPSPFTV